MGRIDLADIRTCRRCRREYLRVLDVDDEPMHLEPFIVTGHGLNIPPARRGFYGWRRTDRVWAVHNFVVAPDVPGFIDHTCVDTPRATLSERDHMTADPFGKAAPPGASGPPQAELANRLLLIDVKGIERGITTQHGEGDAVRTDVVCLDNGEKHTDALLWGKVLVGQLTAGVKYVGRLAKGEASGSKSPPWVWQDGSDADKQTAVAYLTHAASQSVGATTAPAAATPAQPAAGTPAPPWAS